MIKGISSTSIDQGDLLYLDLDLLSIMMIKGIYSTLIIWNWNDDQGDLLYLDLDLLFAMMIKGIYSTLIIWN